MAIQTVTINVEAQPTADRIQTFLVLSQNENGRQIRFRILGDELPAGCTATLSGEKPDGNVWSKAGTVSDNFVTMNEDIQMTAVAGRWDAQLDIVHGLENIVTAPIRITIEPASVDAGAVPSDTQLEGYVEQCKQYAETAKDEAYGSPLTAATAATMTDQSRVYVYTGSETGYTSGHWYYYNGSAWTDGGVYNAVAVDTDTTLSISGKAADAKKTGDEITELKSGLSDMINSACVTDSASGSVAHFADGADDVPLKSLNVNIEPVQSGSGDPSPDNVRAISGRTSITVSKSGEDTSNATDITIQLGQTVYGGTLDVVSGELTVDRAIVDLGSLSWGYSEPRFYSGSVTDGISPSDTGDLNAVCEKYTLYETGALANQPDLSFFVNSSKMSVVTKRIVIRDSNYTDAGSLKTALNGVHLVYTLATPITYNLTPTEVKSLLGINNIWSDAGDVDVEYRANTKLYIDKRLAEVTA